MTNLLKQEKGQNGGGKKMPVDKLELLQRAKEYMESLAEGTDPVSGQKLSREDPMGSERMARCFAFVAAVLEETIAQRKSQGKSASQSKTPPVKKQTGSTKKKEKAIFSITPEQLAAIGVEKSPISLKETAHRLNTAASYEKSEVDSVFLADGLEALGLLKYEDSPDGKRRRIPTTEGYEIGLERHCISLTDGSHYWMNVLTPKGQQFLLEHLEEILEQARLMKKTKEKARAVEKARKMAEKAKEVLNSVREDEIKKE